MKIEYFREFTVLAEYLNFSAAAENLFITQPVLSRHMAALEAHLGVKLLNRTTHSVSLTEAGKLFLEKITEMLDDYDQLLSLLKMHKAGYENQLCVGVPYYAINDYLGSIPELFLEKYPNIKLHYVMSDPNVVLENLIEDKADVIIIPHMHFPMSNEMEFFKLFEEPLGILISRDDPLANKKACTLADLRDKTFMSINDKYFMGFWEQTKNLCLSAGFDPGEPIRMHQVESALISLRQKGHVMMFGWHMRILESKDLAFLKLEEENSVRTVSICCKKGNYLGAIKKFIDMFTESKL
jgi:DNA-binding transcriptional LysR family regulator